MLTTTAIQNPVFLAKVRRAMADTGRRALAMAHPITAATVRNRHGAPVLEVRFFARPYSGPAAFEFIDVQDNDITAQVRRAIQTSKGVN